MEDWARKVEAGSCAQDTEIRHCVVEPRGLSNSLIRDEVILNRTS